MLFAFYRAKLVKVEVTRKIVQIAAEKSAATLRVLLE